MRYVKMAAALFGLCCLMVFGIGAVVAQEVTQEATEEPTIASLTPVPQPMVEHVVRAGENLYRIALRYGSTINAIAQENGITNPALIRSGTTLRIPGVVPTPTPTPVTPVTPVPTTPPPPTATYTVRPGDTLRAEAEVLEIKPSSSKPDRGILRLRYAGINQRGEKVISFILNHLLMRKAM